MEMSIRFSMHSLHYIVLKLIDKSKDYIRTLDNLISKYVFLLIGNAELYLETKGDRARG